MTSVYRIQQTLIITGILLSNISDGFIFGQMSGMLDDLRKDNATIPLNDDNVSWIASTINVTCFCGFAIMATISEFYGRRKSVIIAMIPAIISWIMTYLATDMTTLVISRVLAGISYGCTLFISYVNIGEYMSPNMRPISFNLLVCVGSLIGTMLGHTLSLLMSWRNVALVGLILSIISIILPCFWVESPMWLAAQGRFQECEVVFRTLRMPSDVAEKELHLLFVLEMDKRNKVASVKNSTLVSLKKTIVATKQLYFWKVNILAFVISINKIAGGRILFNTLAITMLQDITGTSNILFFILLTNGFAIFGAAASCVLLKRYKIRALLFPTALIANVLLVGLGALIYFRPDKSEFENWLKVFILSLYLVILGIGPYAVSEALLTEIYPLEVKSVSICMQGAIIGTIQCLAIKLAPNMFVTIGYHGVFFLNATVIFICLGYLWIFLPETKDRSLQEIELFFKTNSFTTDVLERDENKELIHKLDVRTNEKRLC